MRISNFVDFFKEFELSEVLRISQILKEKELTTNIVILGQLGESEDTTCFETNFKRLKDAQRDLDILPDVEVIQNIDTDLSEAEIGALDLNQLLETKNGKKWLRGYKAYKSMIHLNFAQTILIPSILLLLLFLSVELFPWLPKWWVMGLGSVFCLIIFFLLVFTGLRNLVPKKRVLTRKIEKCLMPEIKQRGREVKKVINRWNLDYFLPMMNRFGWVTNSGCSVFLIQLNHQKAALVSKALRSGDSNPLELSFFAKGECIRFGSDDSREEKPEGHDFLTASSNFQSSMKQSKYSASQISSARRTYANTDEEEMMRNEPADGYLPYHDDGN